MNFASTWWFSNFPGSISSPTISVLCRFFERLELKDMSFTIWHVFQPIAALVTLNSLQQMRVSRICFFPLVFDSLRDY